MHSLRSDTAQAVIEPDAKTKEEADVLLRFLVEGVWPESTSSTGSGESRESAKPGSRQKGGLELGLKKALAQEAAPRQSSLYIVVSKKTKRLHKKMQGQDGGAQEKVLVQGVPQHAEPVAQLSFQFISANPYVRDCPFPVGAGREQMLRLPRRCRESVRARLPHIGKEPKHEPFVTVLLRGKRVQEGLSGGDPPNPPLLPARSGWVLPARSGWVLPARSGWRC
jgi:hypothetical protein